MNRVVPLVRATIPLLIALVSALPAHATLGGDVASVVADQAALHAEVSVVQAAGYVDHVLRLPRGLVVHEFVNPAGQVFEVTWSGRGLRPNMYQLLGGYAERMAVPANAVRPMARHSDIVFPDLVIHSAVHARFFSGSAHLPTMIPKSLSGPIPVPVDTP